MRSIAMASNEALSDAIACGDAVAVAAICSEEAKLLPPGIQPLAGRAAAERFWRSAIEAGVCGNEFETLEPERHEDTAHEIGRYALTSAPLGAEPTIEHGTYVSSTSGKSTVPGACRRRVSPNAPPEGGGAAKEGEK